MMEPSLKAAALSFQGIDVVYTSFSLVRGNLSRLSTSPYTLLWRFLRIPCDENRILLPSPSSGFFCTSLAR